MKGLVLLTGEAPELALAELHGALKALDSPVGISHRTGQSVILDDIPPRGLAPRLGFSHFSGIVDEITGISQEEIIAGGRSCMGQLDPGYSLSWTVRAGRNAKGPAPSSIFRAIEEEARRLGLKIRHRNPDVTLFIIVHDQAFIGRVHEVSSRSLANSRRGSSMPFNRPVIMDPRLARVLVNLSGLSPGMSIIDPFLGPAGLAAEAADLGLVVLGIEKDPNIYRGALRNIEHLGLSDRITAVNADSKKFGSYPWARELPVFDGIITDPPFGRSAATYGEGPGKLLSDVLEETSGFSKKGSPLVVDAPDPDHIRDICGYSMKRELSLRVHKSMTRYIGVLEKI